VAFEAQYKKADNFSKFVNKRKRECKEAIGAIASPIRAWVDNVQELNTENNEYGPSVSTDGAELILTSNRPNGHTANEVGVHLRRGQTVVAWDGRDDRLMGTASQALASLVLRWSQR
jgi:hypothetical protein